MSRRGFYGITAAAALCALSVAPGAAVLAQESESTPATEYAAMLADIDSMRRYNEHLERLIETQQVDIESLTAQTASLDAVAEAVDPLLQRMYSELAEFVRSDLPFLVEERMERLDRLETLMAQPAMWAEKFRRLMEAYQIEIEYGRTMAAYEGALDDGRDAEFVHLGRVSLMYRTVDGTETGYWDAERGAWVADSDYARAIDEALRMAKEEIAPDLVILPLPAPREPRS
ncbi:MAG TPA: DUF3450 domain-containing protein [Gammaproteobacteria bacterium]